MILLLLGCACPDRRDLDYADVGNWICHPDAPCDAPITLHTVEADGSITTSEVEADPDAPIDCFHVYPTVDLSLRRGNSALDDLTDETDVVMDQAGLLASQCRLVAPAYRQATVGTYLKNERKRTPCFEVAYADVEAAFEHYLAELNDGRPFVLTGHSQGAHIGSRLLRERVEGQVDDQLVAAYLLGWPLGPESTSLPVCSSADEQACVMGFKSYLAGEDISGSTLYAEGSPVTCVNPADPTSDEATTLSLAVFPTDLAYGTPVDDGYAAYPDAYTAACHGTGTTVGLEVAWVDSDRTDPTDAARAALTGSNASHVLDMNFVLGDLLADIEARSR